MGIRDVTRAGVLRALGECEALGEQAFLERYGYGSAKKYFLVEEGKEYPSKAIVGVAHGFSGDGLETLKFDDFKGGERDVAQHLRRLGFDVASTPSRNPNWTRDELIVALSFYLACDGNPPGKTSKEIIELSETLNQLGQLLGIEVSGSYRNANGVYMKLMNFRRFDERFKSQGKSGLTSGGKTEAEVWKEFADDQVRAAMAANTIIALLDTPDEVSPLAFENDVEQLEAVEGKLVTRLHVYRERSSAIVKKKKAKVLERKGRLACEVCDFDFVEAYGQRGDGFIECHHTKPISSLIPGQSTKISDLALLCANCHRMVHSKRPWLSVDELRAVHQSASGKV